MAAIPERELYGRCVTAITRTSRNVVPYSAGSGPLATANSDSDAAAKAMPGMR
ncbi:hypothetical protein [Nonomuraea zeae]|uniref:hypothetical protein n=1 Tax=Nonomuraea zeae TaxID=1642303 RepID=UPI001478727B|nr:hypothetical protein [Nonomuraea zeae]